VLEGRCAEEISCVAILQAAVDRLELRLQKMVPSSVTVSSLSSQRRYYPPPLNKNATLVPVRSLCISVASSETTLLANSDESYRLWTSHARSSRLEITAPTVYGALRSLQSLWQLIDFGWFQLPAESSSSSSSISTGGYSRILGVPGVPMFVMERFPFQLLDAPNYSYRGILVDTARHFLPLNLIHQQLDVMEWNKLNVMHWHLTDTQSWPYRSQAFPELAAAGAFCEECVYNASDIQEIVKQAALRGIRVVVEVDLPGHSHGMYLRVCVFLSVVDGGSGKCVKSSNSYDASQNS
jgi:hexosaminidase